MVASGPPGEPGPEVWVDPGRELVVVDVGGGGENVVANVLLSVLKKSTLVPSPAFVP